MKSQFFYLLLTTCTLLFMGQGYAENHPPMDNDGMGGCPLAPEQCECIESACPHEDGKGPDPECFISAGPECGVPADMMDMGPGPDGDMGPGPDGGMGPGPHGDMGPGPHGDMGPGPHGDMGPGPHGDMGPGPHGDMGPGPHGDMGPGPHGDMGPGPHGNMGPGPHDDMGPPPAVHECFESGGSPEECCGLMGDEHGKEMCLKHSQDGSRDHGDMGNQTMMCDPEMDYPQADPAPNGCGNYADCNGNGAYDLGEPCAEHD